MPTEDMHDWFDVIEGMIHVRRRRLKAVDEFNEQTKPKLKEAFDVMFHPDHRYGLNPKPPVDDPDALFASRTAATDYMMYLPFTPKDDVTPLDARLARLQVERELSHLYYLKALEKGRLDVEEPRDGYYTIPDKVGRPHYDSLKRMLADEVAHIKSGEMVSYDPSHLIALHEELADYIRTLYFERPRTPEFIVAGEDVIA